MTSYEILRHLNRRHHLGGSVSPSSSQSSLSLESAKSNLAKGGVCAFKSVITRAQYAQWSCACVCLY